MEFSNAPTVWNPLLNSVIWPRTAPNYVYAAVCISKLASSIEDGMLRVAVLTLRYPPISLAAPDR
jgi:hypothetical protein